jgi:PTH1 family peptidyl-tRNA hydrolase
MVVDALLQRLEMQLRKPLFRRFQVAGPARDGGGDLYFARTLTFMNRTGDVVRGVLRYLSAEPSDLLVVCDSLDLPPGRARLRRRGSAGGHRGLESVITALGTDDLSRISVGIGHPGSREAVVDYVLAEPTGSEAAAIEGAVVRVADAILALSAEPVEKVMNELNAANAGLD